MYVDENNELKSEALMTGEDEQIEIPHHIPMDSYIQEAEILYHWAQADKDPLIASGLLLCLPK